MMTYAVSLNLRAQRVVVVGGGQVAARKIRDLLDAGANVTVITPSLHPALVALGTKIDVWQRGYTRGMLDDMRPMLVFAATNSREVNEQVAAEARALRIPVNIADDGADGDFTTMATIRRGAITIALSTGGVSPALAAHLRDRLEAAVGDEYVTLAGWLGDLRPLVRARVQPEARRRKLWHAIIHSPALDHLRAGDEGEARAIIDALITRAISESEST